MFNEANSPYAEVNNEAHAKALAALPEADREEAAKKHSINGFLFCNLPSLNMTVGDRWAAARVQPGMLLAFLCTRNC